MMPLRAHFVSFLFHFFPVLTHSSSNWFDIGQ
jgi:hypothetical protein